MISIHAPTRGATGNSYRRCTMIAHFNPRTHEGCDVQNFEFGFKPGGFQSTHPRGVRPSRFLNNGTLLIFQSTHPRGVRRIEVHGKQIDEQISIHAPTRGATGKHGEVTYKIHYFNPRTHEGCDNSTRSAFRC